MATLTDTIKALRRSVAMSFSTFSRLPAPQVEWDADAMRYLMCAFPLVGVVVGLLLFGWMVLGFSLGFGDFLIAVGLTLVPVAVTGGIHLDGLCDVSDALASNAGPERRREILKDPHAGAFAAIAVSAYLLLYAGLAHELVTGIRLELFGAERVGLPLDEFLLSIGGRAVALLCLLPVLSRILSGLAVTCFPRSASKGMLALFQESAEKRVVAAVLGCSFAACAAAALLVWPAGGVAALLTALACFLGLHRLAMRAFGGMSGDLAGFFLQVCELAMLLALAVAWKVVIL